MVVRHVVPGARVLKGPQKVLPGRVHEPFAQHEEAGRGRADFGEGRGVRLDGVEVGVGEDHEFEVFPFWTAHRAEHVGDAGEPLREEGGVVLNGVD